MISKTSISMFSFTVEARSIQLKMLNRYRKKCWSIDWLSGPWPLLSEIFYWIPPTWHRYSYGNDRAIAWLSGILSLLSELLYWCLYLITVSKVQFEEFRSKNSLCVALFDHQNQHFHFLIYSGSKKYSIENVEFLGC